MIPFFDYRRQYRALRGEIDAAIARVIDSGRLILGPEVESFEHELATSLGAPAAVALASGTDALILALRALEIGPGDEVLTVSNAGVPPVAAIRAVGARPRFVDVDSRTLQIDPELLEGSVTPRSRCVLAVHLYGQAAPLREISRLADRHGIPLVEDCAQAQGTLYQGRPVGTWGAVGCFSFYPTKNLGAYGDGGACIVHDPALAERLRRLRMYGFDPGDRSAHIEGLNSRLDELQAAILRVKLTALDQGLQSRRRLASRYGDALDESSLKLPDDAPGARHSYHLYVLRTERREALARHLARAQIGYGVHYSEPVHTMDAYRPLHDGPLLPVTEQACASVLSLPLFYGLEDAEVDRVASVVAAFR